MENTNINELYLTIDEVLELPKEQKNIFFKYILEGEDLYILILNEKFYITERIEQSKLIGFFLNKQN